MLKKIKGLLKEAKVTSDMRKNYPKKPILSGSIHTQMLQTTEPKATIEEMPQKLSVRNS
jgi:hypothetical protein